MHEGEGVKSRRTSRSLLLTLSDGALRTAAPQDISILHTVLKYKRDTPLSSPQEIIHMA